VQVPIYSFNFKLAASTCISKVVTVVLRYKNDGGRTVGPSNSKAHM